MLSIFAWLQFIFTHYICSLIVLQKPCQENFGKFQEFGKSRFGGSGKERYFLKILKWQHKVVRDYKRGKLVSYFLSNAAKICSYGLKFSMSFCLKYFFFSVAISTQVASAPLIYSPISCGWTNILWIAFTVQILKLLNSHTDMFRI